MEVLRSVLDKPADYAPKQLVIDFVTKRLFNKSIYEEVIQIYQENLLYDPKIWEKGLYHLDDTTISEYLGILIQENQHIQQLLGSNLRTKLVWIEENQHIYSTIAEDFTTGSIVAKTQRKSFSLKSYKSRTKRQSSECL